jgi:hypothetical protein
MFVANRSLIFINICRFLKCFGALFVALISHQFYLNRFVHILLSIRMDDRDHPKKLLSGECVAVVLSGEPGALLRAT